ncbi:ABC transporter permease, partial [Pseudoalteromonas shioyasakiensis]|nr:ABC transporter permease [Pseudoalteromonas shioyasakiensis]
MWKFIVRRLVITFPQLILLSVLIFLLAQAMPGVALTGLVDPNIDPATIDEQREKLGLNKPWYEKYIEWVGGVFQGDLGQSFRYKIPVTDLIEERIVNTFWLSVATLIFTYMIAVPLGMI